MDPVVLAAVDWRESCLGSHPRQRPDLGSSLRYSRPRVLKPCLAGVVVCHYHVQMEPRHRCGERCKPLLSWRLTRWTTPKPWGKK